MVRNLNFKVKAKESKKEGIMSLDSDTLYKKQYQFYYLSQIYIFPISFFILKRIFYGI